MSITRLSGALREAWRLFWFNWAARRAERARAFKDRGDPYAPLY